MKGTPVRKHKLLIPLFVLALALGLAACGSSESDEDKIVDVIETSATSADPSNCTELQTAAFNEQNTQESGGAATKACEKEEEEDESNAESVEVSEVEVDGETATATAALTGGDLDGQTVELELVKEDGDWKLNELTGFVDFDAAKIIATLAEGFEEEESIEPALASCIVETLEESSDSEIEELVLNSSGAGFAELAEACQE
jgi:ABC-type glycerol-3-phosphate transport system substrate-binding protein